MITTCGKCGQCYEAGSEEQANEPDRLCRSCFDDQRCDEDRCKACGKRCPNATCAACMEKAVREERE